MWLREKRVLSLLVLLVAAALVVVVAGCGGDDAGEEATTTAAEEGETATTEAEEADEGEAEEEVPAEAVTIDMVSFLPQNHALIADVAPMWMDAVDEATGGAVTINWKGGPETIPSGDLAEALRNGVVDAMFNVTAYYDPLASELRAFTLSQYDPWEERENGFYDYMVDVHRDIGMEYLGRWLGAQPFYLWVNEPVETPEDLQGRSLRTRALYDRFMQALGITPVSVDEGEVYTALERGVVEGFGWPISGPLQNGWTEVTKNVIDHGFYGANNATITINLDTWNELDADTQEAIRQATADFERDMVDYFIAANEAERAALEDEAGVNFITFSEEDAEEYLGLAYEVEWDFLADEMPDRVDELRAIAEKDE